MAFDEQAYQREYHRKWREENREKVNEYKRKRYAEMPLEKKSELCYKRRLRYRKSKGG